MSASCVEIDPEVLAVFLDEAQDLLAPIDDLFVRLEGGTPDRIAIDEVFRSVHSIKGNAPFFGMMGVNRLAHEIESLLDQIRKQRRTATREEVDVFLTGIDEIRRMLDRVRQGKPEVQDVDRFRELLKTVQSQRARGQQGQWEPLFALLSDLEQSLSERAPDLVGRVHALENQLRLQTRQDSSASPSVPRSPQQRSADDSGQTPEDRSAGPEAPRKEARRTMRVQEAHVDAFLGYVGELLAVRDMFGHVYQCVSAERCGSKALEQLRQANDMFTALSAELQASILSIRRMAVRSLLQKVGRIVRDIASREGKEIVVQTEGEDIEIDKSLIDLLDAPLVHLVRNAADHGIELPAEREALGKAPQGRVRVAFSLKDSEVSLQVEDDGAGLDLTALRTKAEALGLVQPGEELRPSALIDLVFASGVSTASTITDISGRGVGMDVVKRAIEDAGGGILLSSERGKGTQVRITLPLSVTTQIMTGYLVEAADQLFLLPMDRIRETIPLQPEQRRRAGAGQEVTLWRGGVLPLYPLAEILGVHRTGPTTKEHNLAVIVESRRRNVGLIVEELRGLRQAVLRPFAASLAGANELFKGGVVLGDGSVALVLDVERVVRTAADSGRSLRVQTESVS